MNKGFLDIETGGFSIDKNGVCEIAVIATDHQLNVIGEFHRLIKPYTRPCGIELVSYKDESMALNVLTVEKLINEGAELNIVMAEFAEFITEHKITTLVGHNIPMFDIPRINYLAGKCGNTGMIMGIELDCTLKKARDQFKNAVSHKQPYLLEMLGIPNPAAHTALGDAYGNIELYKHLTGWKSQN